MADSATLLLSTTDPTTIETVRGLVKTTPNLELHVAPGSEEAAAFLRDREAGLVLVHLVPGIGIDHVGMLLRVIAEIKRPVATLVLADGHHPEQSLALFRLGVADCLAWPGDKARLAYLIEMLTVRVRLAGPAAETQLGAAVVETCGDEDPFLYVPTDSMGRVMEHIHRVAAQDATILLTGETGTGKTRLARLIHRLSPRRDKPFMIVDCGALSPSLIESEMFGHVRGAFTGADRDRAGKLAEVGQGTLLLDEVDALPTALQTKLLRAVDARVFVAVGSNKALPLQARLIAATNRALEEEVAAGRFRADLYYRLNVVGFLLPPLRERPSVIRPMVEKCIEEFALSSGQQVQGITQDALQTLEEYDWPGNIRELRNVIERAVALCPGRLIRLEELPEVMTTWGPQPITYPMRSWDGTADRPSASTLARIKEEAEVLRITEALRKHHNNRRRAAAELGVSRWTLYKKLHKYGLMHTAQTAPAPS